MNYNGTKLFSSLIIILLIFVGCNKKVVVIDEDDKTMQDLIIPESFDFQTSNEVNINFQDNLKVGDTARYKVYLHSQQSQPDTLVYISEDGIEETDYFNSTDPLNSLIATKVSMDGTFSLIVNIPDYINELYVIKNVNGIFTSEVIQVLGKSAYYGGGNKALQDDPVDVLYGVNGGGNLFTINPITGESVIIRQLISGSYTCAIDRFNRKLYTIGKDKNLYKYDIDTEEIELVGHTGMSGPRLDFNETDGIIDFYDEYPDDADKAYATYTPSIYGVGTLAFEDNWPAQGDYDFNDLIVNYQLITIFNADDNVVELDFTFTIKHIGASYINGLGFELPFSASLIQSVSGFNITGNIVTINGKGLETNQAKPVIIVCDNVNANIYQDINIVISLNNPVSPDIIGAPPYNPFIFVNQDRGKEVHLPNYPPTSLANFSYFITEDDTSIPSTGRYYKTSNNLPWAIQISQEFKYLRESKPVNHGYLKFNSWAESGGSLYKDWYINLDGYRDNDNLNTND